MEVNTQVKKEILDILHQNIDVEEKQSMLQEAAKKRRGNNKALYIAVSMILEEYVLPLNINEKLRVPFFETCSEKVFEYLGEIVKVSNLKYFNAVCAEILWMHYHKLELAQISILNYRKMMSQCAKKDGHLYTCVVVSICRIFSKCNKLDVDILNFITESLAYVKNHLDDDDFCILFILDTLLKCNKEVDAILQEFDSAIETLRKNGKIQKAIQFAEDLENYYASKKRKDEIKNTQIKIAKMNEEAALLYDWKDKKYAHNIVHLIQQAINAWKRSGAENEVEERKRLAKQVEPVKVLLLQSLQVINSKPIDISRTIEQMESVIQTATIEKVIYDLAYLMRLYKKEYLIESSKNSFFSNFFATTVLDAKGRIRYVLPPSDGANKQDKDKVLEHQASEHYAMFADAFVYRYLHIVKKHMNITKEKLEFLVEDNAFIPEDRKESFLKGLFAGFELDIITAMSILMPQIENAIRCMVAECGVVVYKIYDNGVEECLSLDTILKLPEVEEIFEENFLFNLKVFFTSDYGFGMRNIVGHGLLSDRELQSSHCLAVWWFVLRMCCEYSGKLCTRLAEQQQAQDRQTKTSCQETIE